MHQFCCCYFLFQLYFYLLTETNPRTRPRNNHGDLKVSVIFSNIVHLANFKPYRAVLVEFENNQNALGE